MHGCCTSNNVPESLRMSISNILGVSAPLNSGLIWDCPLLWLEIKGLYSLS